MSMEFAESLNIKADREKVWEAVTDLEAFARCIPGIQEVQIIDEHNVIATIKVSVGIIGAKFRVEVLIAKMIRPERIEATIKGKDPILASNFDMLSAVDFEQVSSEETLVKYNVNVNIFGKLGMIGAPVAKMKAKSIAKEFGQNLIKLVDRRLHAV